MIPLYRSLTAILLLSIAALSSACRSTSVHYHFVPSPHEIVVQQAGADTPMARVLVGVQGAEREGGKRSGHPLLLCRVRIENKTDRAIRFDPSTAVLVGSDLAEFGEARSDPSGVLSIEGATSRSISLWFPFPFDGSLEAPLLTGVNLQFELHHPSGGVELSAPFERVLPEVVEDNSPVFTFGGGWYYGC